MTWTYNTNNSGPKDRVRFMIGDTDNDRQLISDEEINAVLVRQGNDITRATIEIAEHLEAKFVRRAESRSGDIIADFLTVAGKYRDLANRLRKRAVKGYALNNIADRDTDKNQTKIEQPAIALHEFDYPGVT